MADVKFKISSGLKSIIGRDLITNDFVAIFELVKNSFDARATKVRVVFDLEEKANAAIYIIDNGKGMTEDDIKNKWLFVAYSAKKDGEEDKGSNLLYAGSKGVGRFSCDRLGRRFQLQTRVNGQKIVNNIKVDWGDFEKHPKKEFKDVGVEYFTSQGFEGSKAIAPFMVRTGTILKITELREFESWDHAKLIRLKRSLQKLLDPFPGLSDDRELELVCDREVVNDSKVDAQEQRINGPVKNTIFGKFFEKSTVLRSVLRDSNVITTLVDRGVEIYKLSENVAKICPELASCSVDCDIAFLNTASRMAFTKTMGIEPVKYGSVFLIHNGFRVYPVGEELDDFWRLNRRKQQGYNRYVGTRDLLGCVRVGDPKNLFQEASNREGLVTSTAVEMLRTHVLSSIKRLEAYLTRVTWKIPGDRESLTPDALSETETRARIIKLVHDLAMSSKVKIVSYNKELISILNQRAEAYGNALSDLRIVAERTGDKALLHRVDVAEEKYQELQKRLREQQQQTQAEQNARQTAEAEADRANQSARRNANAYKEEKKRNAILISQQSRGSEFYENFIHDIAGNLKTARLSLEDIIKDYSSIYLRSPQMADDLYDLMEQIENLQSLSRFAISGNFRFDAEEADGDLALFFKVYIERIAKANIKFINIDFKSRVEKAVARFRPTGLGIVIDNLVGNAKIAEAGLISFELGDSGTNWIVEVWDDGKGLDPTADKSRIFEKAYSRTSGSGLGLYFCRKMLDDINGSIVVSSKKHEHGLAFTIRIPKK